MEDLHFPVLDRALAVASLQALHDLAADMEWLAWTDENYLHELPDKWAFSRLAVLPDGTVAGYALCSRKGTRLWLHRLVVGQAFRAAEPTVLREEDLAHAAGPERLEDRVVGDRLRHGVLGVARACRRGGVGIVTHDSVCPNAAHG